MRSRKGLGGWIRAGVVLAAALAVGAAPASAQGRRHALLVGVGDYIHGSVADLDGPPYDVRSLEEVLRRDWNFDRVTSLIDHEATRGAILGALDELVRDTRSGDYVFIFFSGHGTSSRAGADRGEAPSALAASLDPGTGGLLPADIDLRSPDAGDVLLVGRRDLRPRLQQLDGGREVLVVFDACYSGSTVYRTWAAPGEPATKYQPWPTGAPAFGEATALVDDVYPYDNLVYLSASAENEEAKDIPRRALMTRPTIDGQPHGALTDALLRGLDDGTADSDGSGVLTVGELHRYVRRRVESQFPQTPQLLHPPGLSDAPDRAIFSSARVPGPPPPAPASPSSTALRVYLDPGAADVRGRIAGLDGVSVVTREYDLVVEPDAAVACACFTVRHGSGDLLASGLDAGETVRRVEWQVLVHELLGESFPARDFNAMMDILDVEVRNGERRVTARTNAELFVGDTYEMTYGADVPAYYLMVTVDVRGAMGLLVPWTEQDLHPAREGRIPDLRISPPTGTEFVKLFAFREWPAGLDAWMPERGANGEPRVRYLESESELESLLRFVREHAEAASETVRKFPTATR